MLTTCVVGHFKQRDPKDIIMIISVKIFQAEIRTEIYSKGLIRVIKDRLL